MNFIKWLKDMVSSDDNRPIGLKHIKGKKRNYQTMEPVSSNKKEKIKISDLIKGEIY